MSFLPGAKMKLRLLLHCALLCLPLLWLPSPAGAQNGNGSIWPDFPPGQTVNTATRIRYNFSVVQNTCTTDFKILFSDSRYWGVDSDTYLIEHNLYSYELVYKDHVCTTWPQIGQSIFGQASLRMAVPDYNKKGLI